jgi:hypothetical protein
MIEIRVITIWNSQETLGNIVHRITECSAHRLRYFFCTDPIQQMRKLSLGVMEIWSGSQKEKVAGQR